MKDYKEFEDRNLDGAIGQACDWFGCTREQLEIEILQDAKSGIFGIVGARKARVRARRARIDEALRGLLGHGARSGEPAGKEAESARREQPGRRRTQSPGGRAANAAGGTGESAAGHATGAGREHGARPEDAPEDALRDARPGAGPERPERHDQHAPEEKPVPQVGSAAGRNGGHGAAPAAVADGKAVDAREEMARQARKRPRRERALQPNPQHKGQRKGRTDISGPENARHDNAKADASRPDAGEAEHSGAHRQHLQHNRRPGPQRRQRQDGAPAAQKDAAEGHEHGARMPLPESESGREALRELVAGVVGRLLLPLAGHSVDVDVELDPDDRIRATVQWSGDAGLLIGQEGQTLAAVQYLVSRIVSRSMNEPDHAYASLRVQLDIGQYRSRQEDKIRAMALDLAEKVRAGGRPLRTRPLSSYHRRIVHMNLQDYPDIATRSAGDGPLKRVLIYPRPDAQRPDEHSPDAGQERE